MNGIMKKGWTLFILLWMIGASMYGASWKLDRVAVMIDEGTKVSLNVCGKPSSRLVWESSNKNVATVSAIGIVRGHSHGDAVIKAVCTETGESAECLVSVGYKGQNPILPPTWNLFIADGEPHVINGRMYIFGSKDNYNGTGKDGIREWCSEDYHLIWSDDLIHWTDAGEILNIGELPKELREGASRLWAPDVFQDPLTGKFYLTACTNKGRNIILEADKVEGPYTNPRFITLDGKPWESIDPGVLVDDDGKVYIALPKFIVAQLDPNDYSRILPETVRNLKASMPTDNEPFEGPSLRKRGDTYYYIYIQNVGKVAERGARPTRMAYLTSKSPLGPYEYQGLILSTYDYPNAGNVHGSIEPFKGQWYISYHRSVPGLSLTRTANMEPLTFNEDGTIQEVCLSSSGVRGEFKAGETIQASSAAEFSAKRESGKMYAIRSEKQEGSNQYRMTGYPYISFSENGQWTGYRYLDFSKKISHLCIQASSTKGSGKLEIRKSAPDGEVIASVEISSTDGQWKEFKVPVQTSTSGRDAFYIVATEIPTDGKVQVDWVKFVK